MPRLFGYRAMETKRVRIVDIAEELGVSTATVSNVIHGKTKKISDETVRRVQELLEKKGYIPSMAGILLAQNDSRIVGVVINDHEKYESRVLEDAFISSALNHLSAELEKAGLFMMVKVTRKWDDIVRFASMWNLEGMVILGFCEQDYKKLRESMHIPFVVYDGYFENPGRICNLTVDHYEGGFLAGQYLKGLGHRRALCISDNMICMDKERYLGFADGFGEGATALLVPERKDRREAFYREKLSDIRQYTAAFAVSDTYALELMKLLQEEGLRIPEDFSVIGFDDSKVCRMVFPELTSVRQDGEKRAELAVSMLRGLKNGEGEGCSVKIPVSLIKRQSTGICQTDGKKFPG